VELGFADKVLYAEEESPPEQAVSLLFSRAAVTNSLLGKIPKPPPEKPTGTPIESLDKRLSLILH
jgi:ATP-dependent Clp protease protease subunit